MKRPFILHIGSIRGRAGNREDIERSDILEDLRSSNSWVPEGESVAFSGFIEAIDGGVVAEGEVRSSWEGECRRCLNKAAQPIVVPVREVFEESPTEGETYPLDRDVIDIEPMLREAVMLELPIAPICKEDCAGLCPNCGIERNEATCDCSVEVTDPRWAALDALKTQD